jgi:hypothetical protein
MITIPELAVEARGAPCCARVAGSARRTPIWLNSSISRGAFNDCISNSGAHYHASGITMPVSSSLRCSEGRDNPTTNAADFAHVITACLFHDIGYVRGLLSGDSAEGYVIDAKGTRAELPRGSSDAALLPYHVDRSKLYVMERFANVKSLDANRIANAIEFTRFPSPPGVDDEDNEDGMLVRCGGSHWSTGDRIVCQSRCALLRIREVGMNKQLGYTSPADLTDLYPQFYWGSVSRHIQRAIRYLNITSSGRQWIASLYSNVFRAERELSTTLAAQ